MSCHIEFQHSPKHRATLRGDFGSKQCKMFVYSGGGFRWTKIDVSIQVGTMLFAQTVNLGTEWKFDLTLNENFEDAITYINVQFGDYTFSKGKLTIGKDTPETQQQLLKQRMERNAHLQIQYTINTGEECCLIL